MKTNDTINDRIIQFVEYLNMDLDIFARLCEVNPDVILNDKLEPGSPCLKKIIAIYPELNPKWLKLGYGSMLGAPKEPYVFDDIDIDISNLIRKRMSMSKIRTGILDRLLLYKGYLQKNTGKYEKESTLLLLYNSPRQALELICKHYPNLNLEWLVFGEGCMVYDWKQFGYDVMPIAKKEINKSLTEVERTTAEWALKSYAFRFVMSCVKTGISMNEIFEISHQAQKEIPEIFNTRDGNLLTFDMLRIWIYIETAIVPRYLSENT